LALSAVDEIQEVVTRHGRLCSNAGTATDTKCMVAQLVRVSEGFVADVSQHAPQVRKFIL